MKKTFRSIFKPAHRFISFELCTIFTENALRKIIKNDNQKARGEKKLLFHEQPKKKASVQAFLYWILVIYYRYLYIIYYIGWSSTDQVLHWHYMRISLDHTNACVTNVEIFLFKNFSSRQLHPNVSTVFQNWFCLCVSSFYLAVIVPSLSDATTKQNVEKGAENVNGACYIKHNHPLATSRLKHKKTRSSIGREQAKALYNKIGHWQWSRAGFRVGFYNTIHGEWLPVCWWGVPQRMVQERLRPWQLCSWFRRAVL